MNFVKKVDVLSADELDLIVFALENLKKDADGSTSINISRLLSRFRCEPIVLGSVKKYHVELMVKYEENE